MINYILDVDGRTPIPCPDIVDWAQWFETEDRKVALTVRDDMAVFTVFLSIDHNLLGSRPILFETMVFCGSSMDGNHTRRYATWDEAVAGHEEVCQEVWPSSV